MTRIAKGLHWMQSVVVDAQWMFLLYVRAYVAHAFFLSGLTKTRDWSVTVALFTDEYHVPWLSPSIAAALGTATELSMPVLLMLGLAGRGAAFVLFVFNIVAVISYPALEEAQRAQHFTWGVMLAIIVMFGSGGASIDRLLASWWRRWFAGAAA